MSNRWENALLAALSVGAIAVILQFGFLVLDLMEFAALSGYLVTSP